MYEEAADNFAKDLENKLGKDYTVEDLLRYQMDIGLITPKTTSDYNVKKKIVQMREAQKGLPHKERLTNRQINDEIACSMNVSYSTVYNMTKGL